MVAIETVPTNLLFLLSVPGLYCLLVLGGRQLKRKQLVRLGWPYHLFALPLAVFLPMCLMGIYWHRTEFEAATIIFGSVFVIALVDRYVWQVWLMEHHKIEVPKFLTEVGRLIILFVAAFFVLFWLYRLNIEKLLIAPGILAIVIGLAMQDLIGNIIAGLALQVGKPYAQGDWLEVDSKFAQVIEINWRATRLLTNDGICIEIPHREMSAKTIVNLNKPTKAHAMRLSVGIDYSTPPTRVKDVLLHATANAKGIAAEPRPTVYLKNFGDSSIEYEIKFWLEDQTHYFEVCDSIRTNVWYSLRRHGINIPFPIRTVQIERPAKNKTQELQSAARTILRQQPIFKALSDVQFDALLPRGRIVHFGRGEKLIEQGAEAQSMFILVEGEAHVIVARDGKQAFVAALNSGDCFGEMSLLTGEKRSATVIAIQDCETVEIGKPILAQSLKENPELLLKLSELLAARQMENEGALARITEPNLLKATQAAYKETFADRLRKFFEL
ncbi:MAG TPA: mechanosensitive ion channel family protein [Verrucomicrobiae bacterium]|jgi:small-conductance mechanosensitive channel/CRP-like cAMP-binding protein|nr:mechanosensitive ion channel family protein [Verrucomicrobiae bacterium]